MFLLCIGTRIQNLSSKTDAQLGHQAPLDPTPLALDRCLACSGTGREGDPTTARTPRDKAPGGGGHKLQLGHWSMAPVHQEAWGDAVPLMGPSASYVERAQGSSVVPTIAPPGAPMGLCTRAPAWLGSVWLCALCTWGHTRAWVCMCASVCVPGAGLMPPAEELGVKLLVPGQFQGLHIFAPLRWQRGWALQWP